VNISVKRTVLFVVVLGLVLGLVPALSFAEASQSDEVGGVAVELPDHEQEELKNEFDDVVPPGVSVPTNAFVLIADGGEEYLVLTDEQPQTGSATVTGESFEVSAQQTLLIADSVAFETAGEPVAIDEFVDDPGAFENEHIRVEGDLRQVAAATETAGIREPLTIGVLKDETDTEFGASVGMQARFSSIQLSSEELGDGGYGDLEALFPDPKEGVAVEQQREGAFWMDTAVTADLVVADENFIYVADVTPVSERSVSVTELTTNGEQYVGDVVTIDADAVGTATSSKDYLTSVAPCGDDAVVVGVTPPGCVPVVTDTTMHSGVLFEGVPDSHEEVVLYAGASDIDTDAPTVPEEGRYEVTGEVVATSEIDPALPDGYAVLVYDRARTGSVSTTGEVEALAADVTNEVQAQLEADANDDDLTATIEVSTDSNRETEHGGAADIVVEDVEFVRQNVSVGGEAVVEATITNHGDTDGEKDVTFQIGAGDPEPTTVAVPAGESVTEQFTHTSESTKRVALYVDGERVGMAEFSEVIDEDAENGTSNDDSDSVNDDSTESEGGGPDDDLPGFGVTVAVVALLGGVLGLQKRIE
jgi:PGF-CTERM protein